MDLIPGQNTPCSPKQSWKDVFRSVLHPLCFFRRISLALLACRLKHKDTGAYLASHNVKYERPIPGQTEVHALKTKSVATVWKATEGVYFPEQRHD